MKTVCFPDRRPNEFCLIDSVNRNAAAQLRGDDYDDDEEGEGLGADSQGWDDVDDNDGEFDPEPSDADFDDDFEIDPFSDEAERPPEELWNEADWE